MVCAAELKSYGNRSLPVMQCPLRPEQMLPWPLTLNTFVTVGQPFCLSPLCPLSLLCLIYHLPLWGWLYLPTQNQPHCSMEMPPLWTLLCKCLRVAYSNHVCEYDFCTLTVSFHDHYESRSPSFPFSLSWFLAPPFFRHLFRSIPSL